MGAGFPKTLKRRLAGAKSAAQRAARAIGLAAGTAERAMVSRARIVARDAFAGVNREFMRRTSGPGRSLISREIALVVVACDTKRSPAERAEARTKLRTLMGAEPEGVRLDPLPPQCGPQAERVRTSNAKPGNPSREKVGRWSTADAAGRHPSDPVNLYVHGTLAGIVRAFQTAGWSLAHPTTKDGAAAYKTAIARYIQSWSVSKTRLRLLGPGTIPAHRYHAVNRMPMGTLYLDGRPQLLGLQANNHPLTGRDHFRIFETGRVDSKGRNVYAIAASRDVGIKFDLNSASTAFTGHFTERNADLERDFVLETLLATGIEARVTERSHIFVDGPTEALYSQDGKVYDVVLPER